MKENINQKFNQDSPSPWNYKPWWCQPWSIILTGLTIITFSWLVLHNLIITILATIAITAWWVYFLIIYPKLMAQVINDEINN